MRPLREADFSRVKALFSDVDGTLTTHDQLEGRTLDALAKLRATGVRVVLVSGRSAGWGDAWARQWPVDGVIVENGGLWFVREKDGTIAKRYFEPDGARAASREGLVKAVRDAMALVEGAVLSQDSAYREVDLAIDYNEGVHLGREAAHRMAAALAQQGVTAVPSSVHVNCWTGGFDKAKAVAAFVEREWGEKVRASDPRWAYVGDSFNDAPMFKAFRLSVGVANVRDVADTIDHLPAFVTPGREAAGARALMKAIRDGRRTAR